MRETITKYKHFTLLVVPEYHLGSTQKWYSMGAREYHFGYKVRSSPYRAN